MWRLENKHVVVTGASAGIGAELCRQLGGRKCRVVLAARRTELLEQVGADVRKCGGEALVVPTDVTDKGQVLALAAAAEAKFGAVDVWINNAGGGILHRLTEATGDDMVWQYRLNCLSSLWSYQAVIPAMLKRDAGTVVDVCSLGGKSGFAFGGGYVAAKAALSNLGDAMRQELLGTGVRVITSYPGVTETDFSDVRPDRTAGTAIGDGAKLRRSGSFLQRTVLRRQSATDVCRSIIRAVETGRPTVYPHRWGALAVLMMQLWPGLTLRIMAKLRRKETA